MKRVRFEKTTFVDSVQMCPLKLLITKIDTVQTTRTSVTQIPYYYEMTSFNKPI